MPFWKTWIEPRRRLLTMFVAIAALSAATLLWLGWQLVRQDREVAAQRLQERREIVADRAVAALQESLARAEEQLRKTAPAAYADTLPGDSLLVLARANGIEAFPRNRLPFYPAAPATGQPDAALFAESETLEFRQQDFPKAIAALRTVAHSADAGIRAAALLRIARIHRKQGQWNEALAIYDEMSAMPDALVEALPAGLVARQARLGVFESQKNLDGLRQEAAALLDGLLQRRWRLTRGAYEFYMGEARRVLGETGGNQEDPAALALAAAVESLNPVWRTAGGRGGRSLRGDRNHSLLAMWRGSEDRTVALLLGPQWIAAQLSPSFASQGAAVGLTDLEGNPVAGAPANLSQQAIRFASATQLPWNLHVVTTAPELALPANRQRLLATGLAMIALLILAGSYLIGRAVMRDLTLSRLQSDFVSAVSHEFRTPLTSLCLLTEQLASGRVSSDEDKAEYYDVLARESQRLRRLVEGLLNFGRMEAGAVEYRLETVDPAELVESVAREFEKDVVGRGYHVAVHAEGDTPLLRADRAALACAVWNLLDNAVKYSPECHTVWADVARQHGRAAIHVRDRGFGIPAAEQARIFEKFVRGEKAREESIRGTGVGLAMVHHIVAAHGGEIRLESKTGEGSTFTMLLPGAN